MSLKKFRLLSSENDDGAKQEQNVNIKIDASIDLHQCTFQRYNKRNHKLHMSRFPKMIHLMVILLCTRTISEYPSVTPKSGPARENSLEISKDSITGSRYACKIPDLDTKNEFLEILLSIY